MLTKVILENYRSYKERTEFDLLPSKYQILQDTNTFDGVLKAGLLVGPNASGKSTLIVAIRKLLALLFLDNIIIREVERCLFCRKELIHMEYHFKIDDNKIEYLFKANKLGDIVIETLKVNDAVVLNRNGLSGEVILNNNSQSMDNKFTSKVLLLRKCYFSDVFANEPVINKFMEFLKHSIYIDASEKSVEQYNNETHIITEIQQSEIDEINQKFDELNIGFNISKSKENTVSKVKNEDGNLSTYLIKSEQPTIFFKRHDIDMCLPLNLESLGNETLVNIFPSVLYCCKNSSMLLIDEFSSGFHNNLEELIIRYFLQNSNNSQVIFTSHSSNLLSTRLLRPDQIYTVDFGKNGSFIERFSDENPREAQNLEKMYLSGKFGALPNYNL